VFFINVGGCSRLSRGGAGAKTREAVGWDGDVLAVGVLWATVVGLVAAVGRAAFSPSTPPILRGPRGSLTRSRTRETSGERSKGPNFHAFGYRRKPIGRAAGRVAACAQVRGRASCLWRVFARSGESRVARSGQLSFPCSLEGLY
jgi:hypothetical protein